MNEQISTISDRINSAKGKEDLEKLLSEVDAVIEEIGSHPDVLHVRAFLNLKMQKLADAINDYSSILKVAPEDETARFQVEHLKTILKFNNTDIYANPNTNLDPWLD